MKLLRRWRYVVDSRSQLGTALQIVAVLAGICLICAVAVKYVKSDEALELMSGEAVRNFLYRVTAAQFLVSAVTLGVLAIYLTHRFAGPAIALERAIRAILQGETDRKLNLRQRDYLKEVALAVEDLRVREETRARKLADLDRCLAEGDAEGAKEIVKGLVAAPAAAPGAAPKAEPEPAAAAQC